MGSKRIAVLVLAGLLALPTTAFGQTVLAAGDVQNPNRTCAATTGLLRDTPKDAVLGLGDLQYETGNAANFANHFRPCWGDAAPYSKFYPAPGNHESTKAGYCGEMGGRTPVNVCPNGSPGDPQHYRFTVGEWEFFSMDTGRSSGTDGNLTGPAKEWLRQQLAAPTTKCQAVYWHHPRYSAGDHGSNGGLADDWQMMMDSPAKVDLVLAGHDHNYQRFARLNANGGVDQANGIRSFVVGTGGRSHYDAGGNPTGLEVKNSNTFGLLQLSLRADGYDWKFLPAGGSFTDSGSEACR